MPGRGDIIGTKGRFTLTVTPAGRYSIYERIGDRDENLYAKLKEQEAMRLWNLIDKVLEIEETTSRPVTLEDVMRTDRISSIGYRERAEQDKMILEKLDTPQPTRIREEFVEEFEPPVARPMPVEKRRQWAVMASGRTPKELMEVRYSPTDMRSYREVVGWSPTEELIENR